MKRFSTIQIALVTLIVLVTASGCGLAASDEDRIARAEEQISAGEYRAAMIELKNVLASDANNATARTMLATVSLGLGDVLAAEKELGRAAELDAPESAIRSIHLDILVTKRMFAEVLAALGTETGGLTEEQQWFYRGEALLGLKNADAAKATFEEWLQKNPAATDAGIGIARAETIQGEIESAIGRLEEITAASPENEKAWQALGLARFRSGDFDGAESALNNAVNAIRPQSDVRRYASVLGGLVEAQLILDKKDEARRNLDRLEGVASNAPSTFFLAAKLARSNGDYALASRHLQNLLNVSPDNSQAQYFLANMQLMQGNFAQAERLLHRVVAMAPDNIQARKLLARTQLQQSQPGGAIEALAPALESGEDDPDIYAILAQASLQEGDTESAIRQFRTASDLAPNDMEAKINLATAYHQANETALALEVLAEVPEGAGNLYRRERLLIEVLTVDGRQNEADEIAVQLLAVPDQRELAVSIVANHYHKTGRSDEARSVLRDLLQKQDDAVIARSALAHIEMSDGNFDVAQELFSSVIDADENNLSALVGLARIAQQAGEETEVIQLLKQAAESHPQSLGPKVLLAGTYLKSGDVGGAEQLANEVVSIGFRNSYISEVIAKIYLEAGRTDDALFHYQQAAKLNSDSATIQLGIARAYLLSNRSVEAREALNRALDISPGLRPAMILLALIEIRQGQLDEAQLLVSEYRSLYSDDVAGMILEGEIHLYKQEFVLAAQSFGEAVDNGAGRQSVLRQYQALVDGVQKESESVLEKWLVREPQDTVVRTFLAQHHQVNNRGDRAIQEYERVLELAPDNATVMNNLAWQYQQDGNLERAVELAEAAQKINPESGAVADTLGWIYRDMGQLDKSSKMLSDASQLAPDNGEIAYHYAVVLNDTGEVEKARQILLALKNNNMQFPSRKLADDLLEDL